MRKFFLICGLQVVFDTLTFHVHFVRFSYVHGLARDVKEIMPITCSAFYVKPMTSKFALFDLYM